MHAGLGAGHSRIGLIRSHIYDDNLMVMPMPSNDPQVCDGLGIELEVVPMTQAYWDKVVSHSVHEIREGRTPNPDMLCNSRVKFGAFYEYLEKQYGSSFDRCGASIWEWHAPKWLATAFHTRLFADDVSGSHVQAFSPMAGWLTKYARGAPTCP